MERGGQPTTELCVYQRGTSKQIFVVLKECNRVSREAMLEDDVITLLAKLHVSHVHSIATQNQYAQFWPVRYTGDSKLKFCTPFYAGAVSLWDVTEVFSVHGETCRDLIEFVKNHQIDGSSIREAFLGKVLVCDSDINPGNFALSAVGINDTLATLTVDDPDGADDLKIYDVSGTDRTDEYNKKTNFTLMGLDYDAALARGTKTLLWPYGELFGLPEVATRHNTMFSFIKEGNLDMNLTDFYAEFKNCFKNMIKIDTHVRAMTKVVTDMYVAGYDARQLKEDARRVVSLMLGHSFGWLPLFGQYVKGLSQMKYGDKEKDAKFIRYEWMEALRHGTGLLGYAHEHKMKIGGLEPRDVILDAYKNNKPLFGRNCRTWILACTQSYLPQCGRRNTRYLTLQIGFTEATDVLEQKHLLPFGLDKKDLESMFADFKQMNVADIIEHFRTSDTHLRAGLQEHDKVTDQLCEEFVKCCEKLEELSASPEQPVTTHHDTTPHDTIINTPSVSRHHGLLSCFACTRGSGD